MKIASYIFYVVTLLCSFFVKGHAQFDSLGLNTKWTSGSIILDDNTTLKGVIQFNDKLGMIKFKTTPQSVEESFVETSIAAMQLYDEDADTWRDFAVFNVKDVQTGLHGRLLFEVLMEFGHFALVTRVDRVNVALRVRPEGFATSGYQRVGYEQLEHLCLVDEEGNATVVLSVSQFEKNYWAMASHLKPSLNKRALETYLADDWDAFEALVKKHQLNLKKRADFIRAFEYYSEAAQEVNE